MPLDPRVQRFLGALAAAPAGQAADVPVTERRAQLAALMQLSGPRTPVQAVEERTIGAGSQAMAVRLYVPPAAAGDGGPTVPQPGIVYFHGGGLVAGSLATHDPIARALAAGSRCRVVSVGYRLAPEYRYPAALDDALAAIRHVSAHAAAYGIDARRLGVCGDSAGGTLAAAACQEIARSGGPPLRLQLLLCPILDYGGRSASRLEFASGYLVGEDTLQHDLRNCLPAGMRSDDPRISPLRAPDLAGQPPTIIHTAEFDPLRDEGAAYHARLLQAGCDATLRCHAGMIHLFYGLAGVIPYARTALAEIAADAGSVIARGS